MENYDVIVIGGGPAGLMAAGRAGELKKKVLLLEKNPFLGKKLLITGKGRGNITRADFNIKEIVKEYGKEGDFLLAPFSFFGPKETVDFFERKGLRLKTERGKRVFPRNDKSSDILNALMRYLKNGNVEISLNSRVKNIIVSENKITKILLENGRQVTGKSYIITTGGKSYPETGSTGEGYVWAKKLGHKIEKPRPSLVPLRIKESWPKECQGLSLKNVSLSVFLNGKKKDHRFGEMLFTHFGISGPIVLDLSQNIGEFLGKGQVELSLDLKPALNLEVLEKRIQRDFMEFKSKIFKNSLDELLPQKIIPVIIKMSGVDPFKKVSEISKKEGQHLAKTLKAMRMTVLSLMGFDMAIVTAGGISLKEIDSKTMKSKIIDNLFFAGEIINLQGPTGGYNLQLCWSTGYLAGEKA